MIVVIARHMADNGYSEEHIIEVKWRNTDTGLEDRSSVAAMVEFIDKGNKADTGTPLVQVITVHGNGRAWLTTTPDATTKNNLLSLPVY